MYTPTPGLLRNHHCFSNEYIQIMAAKTQDITIITVYIAPAHGIDTFKLLLHKLEEMVQGRTAIIGDLNARHTSWDKCSNAYGNALNKWAKARNITIHTPAGVTFSTQGRSSTVDLAMTKAMHASKPITVHGTWNEHTDHILITTDITTTILNQQQSRGNGRIPTHIMRNETLRMKAKAWYARRKCLITGQLSNARSTHQLDTALTNMTKTLWKPWQQHSRPKPGRYKIGWSKPLDEKAKTRTRLLKLGKKDPNALQKAKQLDKDIKRTYRQNVRKTQQDQVSNLSNLNPQAISQHIMRLTKKKKSATTDTPLQPTDFTHYMREKSRNDTPITTIPFNITENIKTNIHAAIRNGKRNKAPGPDGITWELLSINPDTTSQWLTTLWTTIGKLAHMPEQLREAIFVPIYKKGDRTDPESYRPVALMSHIRKVLSAATDTAIRQHRQFHPMQWGFTQGVGTEQAIIQACRAISLGATRLAVLDLKGAYDNVPRKTIMTLAHESLNQNLCGMISALLSTNPCYTQGDVNKQKENFTTGVPQGDTASPTLFNIFMDTFLEEMNKTERHNEFPPAICYADDVLLLAKFDGELQTLLDKATTWAKRNSMTWSIKKCTVLRQTHHHQLKTFTLSGKPLQETQQAEYLGITITPTGPGMEKTLERIQSARSRLETFRKYCRGIPLRYESKRRIVLEGLIPLIDYSVHLTPINAHILSEAAKLEKQLTQWITQITINDGSLPRARLIARIPPLTTRRTAITIRTLTRLRNKIAEATNPKDTDKATDRMNSYTLQTQVATTCAKHNDLIRALIDTTNPRDITEHIIETDLQMANKGKRTIPGKGKPAPAFTNKLTIRAQRLAALYYSNRIKPGGNTGMPKADLNILAVILRQQRLSKGDELKLQTIAEHYLTGNNKQTNREKPHNN